MSLSAKREKQAKIELEILKLELSARLDDLENFAAKKGGELFEKQRRELRVMVRGWGDNQLASKWKCIERFNDSPSRLGALRKNNGSVWNRHQRVKFEENKRTFTPVYKKKDAMYLVTMSKEEHDRLVGNKVL